MAIVKFVPLMSIMAQVAEIDMETQISSEFALAIFKHYLHIENILADIWL